MSKETSMPSSLFQAASQLCPKGLALTSTMPARHSCGRAVQEGTLLMEVC